MNNDNVTVFLTRSEALVFFEWLAALGETEEQRLADDAEQAVLWKIEGQLESAMPEVLAPNYQMLLKNAKRDIQG